MSLKNIGDFTVRLAVAAAVSCILLSSLPAAERAAAAITQVTNIPAEGLGSALETIARDRKLQLIYATDDVGNRRTEGAVGNLSTGEALKRILKGTGLSYQFLDDKTVTVQPFVLSNSRQSETGSDARNSGPENSPRLEDLRLAQANQGALQRSSTLGSDAQDASSSSENSPRLEEILVTAQKKTERLQDVPVPVTVLDAETLSDRGQNRLQDYFATVPGLGLSQGGSGRQTLAIRGIVSSDVTDPTIGVTIDDVPVGGSARLSAAELLPADIDPSDLERVEVLRGPQGTLYGASSLGGLIKYVTTDPSTDGLSGRVQVLGDNVDHGEAGFGVRGAVNVPLSDTVAIRASAFKRRDPGYVDNVITGQRDVNRVDVSGGRVSAIWHMLDTVTFKLSALLQNTGSDGNASVDTNSFLQPTLGDLKQARLRGGESYCVKTRLYTATLSAKLGSLDFISISGYGTSKYFEDQDNTLIYGSGPGSAQSFFGVSGANAVLDLQTEKFTQEFRLSSVRGSVMEWLIGGFYTYENTAVNQYNDAVNPATGVQVGNLIDYNFPSTLSEYDLFGDMTFHVSERFDVQIGGRESANRQRYNETDSGPLTQAYFGFPPPFVNPTERSKGNAFTYLLTPQFKITPDLMAYARLTSGYRLGSVNLNAVADGVPIQYAPDKTNNYELGVKGTLLDHALTFDASAYYIDWKKLQVTLFDLNGFPYTANAGNAKSQGLELSLQSRPAKGLTIAIAAALNTAELTQNLPAASAAFGVAGERLPFSSRFSGNLSVDQDIALVSNWTGFMGASLAYVGSREGNFTNSIAQARLLFPAYTDLNVRMGARNASLAVNLFVNNVADRRGIASGGPNYAQAAYYAVFIQPRTAGLSITKSF